MAWRSSGFRLAADNAVTHSVTHMLGYTATFEQAGRKKVRLTNGHGELRTSISLIAVHCQTHSMEQFEFDEEDFVKFLEQLISFSEKLQNNPPELVPEVCRPPGAAVLLVSLSAAHRRTCPPRQCALPWRPTRRPTAVLCSFESALMLREDPTSFWNITPTNSTSTTPDDRLS